MNIRENVAIKDLTTMRLGGEARFVIEITEHSDVKAAYDFANEKNLSTWIMGEGANTIGKDDGFDGVILINRMRGVEIIEQDEKRVVLKGMGGENWDDFVAMSVGEKPVTDGTILPNKYTGIEALSKIPGTLGAAPVQNIGAYGQEISQVIVNVEAYDTKTKEFVIIKKPEMKMKYRESIFNTGEDKGRYFIVSVTVELRAGEVKQPFYNSLQAYIDEHDETDFSPANIRKMVSAIRAYKLPDPKEEASAGSFFKNVTLKTDAEIAEAESKNYPVYHKHDGSTIINSGWLIEKAGLKGKEFYGMKISDKAALILINKSAKSYADLKEARAKIVKIVKDKFGYELQQEPVEIPTK